MPMTTRRGRPPLYPWDDWLSGTHRELQRWVDFEAEPQVVQSQIQAMARKRGLVNLRTRRKDDVITITYRAKRRRQPYPWDTWLDGQVHTLGQGEHFTCSVESLLTQARRECLARGLKLKNARRYTFRDEVAIRAVPR